MKLAKGIGLFVVLALAATTVTACGKKHAAVEPNDPAATSQTVSDESGKAAEPKAQTASENHTTSEQGTDGNAKQDGAAGSGQGAATSTASAASTGGASSTTSSSNGTSAKAAGGASGSGSVSTRLASEGSHSGGSAPVANSAGHFELDVMQYFGTTGVFDQSVSYASGQSVMDVMREHLSIETAYGGAFVNAINGTKSGYTDHSIFTRKKRDWFYYVNGSVGAVGVDSYPAHSGDMVMWDYHDWSGSGSNTPCVVGAYPHPFTTGYSGATPGTLILYSGSHASEANEVAQTLRGFGAGNVRTAAYSNEVVQNASTNVIVLGTWSELASQSAVSDLFGSPTASGLYASFGDGKVTALNYSGKVTDETGTAAILATGTGNGDTTPVWLMIGATEAGLDQAVDALHSKPGWLKGKIGVVLNGSGAVGVPIAQ